MQKRAASAENKHSILGGKVHLYRRGDGENWHCSTYLRGKNHRYSTRENSLPLARDIAEDWYLELRGKARAGNLDGVPRPVSMRLPDRTTVASDARETSHRLPVAAAPMPDSLNGVRRRIKFNAAADIFTAEYGVINAGEVSKRWVEGHQSRLRAHLRPFFGDMYADEIGASTAQQYRLHRIKTSSKDTPPARKTIASEITTVHHVLKTAFREGGLSSVPDLAPPFRSSNKIEVRPWFSPDEYKSLYKATGNHARDAKRADDRWYAEQLHDYVLFLANTGLRPDEAQNLEFRDVAMVKDDATGELILEIDVRGKRGVGFCKSMPGAVKPFQRLLNRPKWQPQGRKPRNKAALKEWEARTVAPELPKANDIVFPGSHLKLFNKILDQLGLKFDRNGKPRTAYSLRHTYICMRLTEGADIYQIAKNCRTSVEIIEKHYASHIKNLLDAGTINKRKPRRRPENKEIRPE